MATLSELLSIVFLQNYNGHFIIIIWGFFF